MNKAITSGQDSSEVIYIMTGKELQYVEDALGHAKFMMTQACEAVNTLRDPELKRQAQQLVDENRKMFTAFYQLV